MSRLWSLAVFLVGTVGGGLAVGVLTVPGAWYAALAKPTFNPPNWVFAPVWTVLYILIAVAGWLVWRRAPGGTPTRLWFTQLALNLLWSPTFFAARRIDLALAVILLLLAAILAFIFSAWRQERVAVWLVLPYAAWVAFAAALNASLLFLNPGKL